MNDVPPCSECGSVFEPDPEESVFGIELLFEMALCLACRARIMHGRHLLWVRESFGVTESWEKCMCLEDGESGVPAWHDHSCPRDAADDAAHHFKAIEHLCARCAERLRYGEGDQREVCEAYSETESYP